MAFVKSRIPLASLIIFLSFLHFNCQSTQSRQKQTPSESTEKQTPSELTEKQTPSELTEKQTPSESTKSEVESTIPLELDQRLAAYVPNWQQMTLVHSTREESVAPILALGEIRSGVPFLAMARSSWNDPVYDWKPDWTEAIFTQVVNKMSLNAGYRASLQQHNHVVVIELDLRLLADREDYTVASELYNYWGQRFPYAQFTPNPADEVAEGSMPDRVKEVLAKDFSTNYTGDQKDNYQNEVVFRKAVISLKNMDIKLHFDSQTRRIAMENDPNFQAAVAAFWTIQSSDENTISLKHMGK